MKKKNLIFYNRCSGDGKAEKIANWVIQELKSRGQITEKILANNVLAAKQELKERINNFDRLICIGGDGTLNLVLTVLLKNQYQPAIGLIPAGTVNNFARKWKIPLEPKLALAIILDGNQQAIDVGECNGQAIVSSLIFGSLAEVSNQVRQKDKQRYGLKIYIWQALKKLPQQKSISTEFFNDEFSLQAKVWFCLLSTSNYIGGRKYLKKDDDGLHLTMLNNLKLNKLFNYGYFALTGNLRRSTTLTSFDIKKIIIRSFANKRISTRIDGDPGPFLPLRIVWHPSFINCYVPSAM
ncbi:diacylglycerol/lipid kinase family protein [Liquorilactobacillus sicerae]|uniref:diacylglycerol/lipid kinase family protein n=1 Tax=Liquorilactobacillus sicerae TaxID=1416943 RepID=UPI00247FF026|nr:diacylglycerol kinase family protein [Liquorilactobacillus sicerae]